MYSVKIRDHVMIAHSLDHPDFGIASKLHGATYVVDVEFESEHLNEMNVVIDIALAHHIVKTVLQPLHFKNLDELPQFKGKITTTEYVAWYIHNEIAQYKGLNFKGHLKVILGESHIAWASYSQSIR